MSGPTDASLNHLSLEYPYQSLYEASQGFSPESQLGSGAFGGVFRGIQHDGTEVAIKVLELPDESGFEDEVRVLSKFRHPNLVILMGFARHGATRMLVYELLAGGDVYKRLQRSCIENLNFSWRQRVSTAFDAACGLSHLHHSNPKVFHRDIKSPNILLDRNGTAKMADFGLACLSHAKVQKVDKAGGTVGYTCPLYVQRGVVTEGSEVYSFGIVLLELLTAKLPAWVANGPDGSQQYQFLVTVINNDLWTLLSLVDEKAPWPPQIASAIADLALHCINMQEETRPGFSEIVSVLRLLRDAPDAPQTPQVAPAGRAAPQQGLLANVPARPVPIQVAQGFQPGVMLVAQQPHVIQHQHLQQQEMQQQHILIQQQAEQQAFLHQGKLMQKQEVLVLQQPQPQQHQTLSPGRPLSPRVTSPKPVSTPQGHILWSLECVYAQGKVLNTLSREQCTLVHRDVVGSGALSTHRVGRLFQDEFFSVLIPDPETRKCVSREHFQIWAAEVPSLSDNKLLCSFFLTQFSDMWITVQGRPLRKTGEQSPLHEGDKIALGRFLSSSEGRVFEPFLQFVFSLAGSVLQDAEDENRELPIGSKTWSTHDDQPVTMMAVPSEASEHRASISRHLVVEDRPLFFLEVGGSGVSEGIPRDQCCIYHGPAPSQPDDCPPLVVGRNYRPEFWQSVLCEDAYYSLSRRHLQIEVESGPAERPLSFFVTNLSDRNPIYVHDGHETSAQSLGMMDRMQLCHNDVILVNCKLWLLFQELRAGAAGSSSQPYLRRPRARSEAE